MDENPSPDDHELAEWLAAHTAGDVDQVETELKEGEQRRAFVVDELLDAGFNGAELLDLAVRLTGLPPEDVNALIAARAKLAAEDRETSAGP